MLKLACGKFVPQIVRLAQNHAISLIFLFIGRWIDQLEPIDPRRFELEALLESFLPQSLLLGLRNFVDLASQDPLLRFLLVFSDQQSPFLVGKVQKAECVLNDVLLDFVVERAICAKAGRCIHLQEQGLEFLVDQHVEAQDLETHAVV